MPATARRPTLSELADNPGYTIKDRRERVNDHEARAVRRAEIRLQLAEAKRLESRLIELRDLDVRINEEKERLAAEHVAACRPLQARLSEIEKAQIKLISERQPQAPSLEAERRELLADLEKLNVELETAIAGQDGLLSRNHRDAVEVGRQFGELPAEHKLIHSAPRPLQIALQVAKSVEAAASARLDALEDRLRFAHGDEVLTAIRDDALLAVQAASARAQAAYQACIDAD